MIELSPQLKGLRRTETYWVKQTDMVPEVLPEAPEFGRKPEVMATGRLVMLCEWPPMEALREFLDDALDSLGREVKISHLAPVVVGATLTVTARCVDVVRTRTRWEVTAHDGFELVAAAEVECAVVQRVTFERRRLDPKRSWRVPTLAG